MAAANTIRCPQCGKDIEIPISSRLHGKVIHIVAPGSIIPCPSCGFNLRTEIEAASRKADARWYPLVLLAIGAALGLLAGYLLWKP